MNCASYMLVSLVMIQFGALAFRLTKFRDDRGTYIQINSLEAWIVILTVLASIFVEILRMFKQLYRMCKKKKKKSVSHSQKYPVKLRIGHIDNQIKVNIKK